MRKRPFGLFMWALAWILFYLGFRTKVYHGTYVAKFNWQDRAM